MGGTLRTSQGRPKTQNLREMRSGLDSSGILWVFNFGSLVIVIRDHRDVVNMHFHPLFASTAPS